MFLGVQFVIDNKTNQVKLTHTVMINKFIRITVLEESNKNLTTATTKPIRTYSGGPHRR